MEYTIHAKKAFEIYEKFNSLKIANEIVDEIIYDIQYHPTSHEWSPLKHGIPPFVQDWNIVKDNINNIAKLHLRIRRGSMCVSEKYVTLFFKLLLK